LSAALTRNLTRNSSGDTVSSRRALIEPARSRGSKSRSAVSISRAIPLVSF